ncbi:MAG: type 1 fimbrial protein, partial [Xanthomonadaceae bacterium]|nr:type 1 fimbrial protein [Xanthomonadaceae bacterium]
VASAQSLNCWFTNSAGTPISAPPVQSVMMDSITVPLPSNPSAGSPIGKPVSATVSGTTIYIDCGFNPTTGGLSPLYGTYDPTNNIIYSPTPGVAFQIQRSGNPIPVYNTDNYNGQIRFSNTTRFQLFSTGVLPSNGNQIPRGTLLGQWEIDNICTSVSGYFCNTVANAYPFIKFYSGGVTFTASTCTVSTGSQSLVVTLPTVSASSLTSTGTTAGTKPFSIILTGCTSNRNVSATLSTNNPYASASGVIAPTTGSGYAGNVGIRLLQSDGITPVDFDTAFPVGTTSGANFTFNLYAQYYQTASAVTPGLVRATATYTLTYQ